MHLLMGSFYIEDERVSRRSDREIADFRASKEMTVSCWNNRDS